MGQTVVQKITMSNQQTQTASHSSEGKRFYHALTGGQLILTISPDEMTCNAQLDVKPDGSVPTRDQLEALLTTDGVVSGVDAVELEQLLASALPGSGTSRTIARGRPPVRGTDGRLVINPELTGQHDDHASHDDTDADTRQMDFHLVQDFINVDPEQEIATIIPPGSGTPGCTVSGRPVPAEPGTPLLLKTGQHLHLGGEQGDRLISEIHGRFKQEGDTVLVVDEYVVDGDVDFTVGNIRFNGFVEIHGDVHDGFQISASKGLKITGNVGSCRLVSHGNIEFCGMDGQGGGSILCGGTLTAHFIHGSTVECWNNILIDIEIRACSVRCRGSVTTGTLSGGSLIALGGLEAKKLGAPSALRTTIHCGVAYHDLDRMQELLLQLETVQEKIGRTKELSILDQLQAEKQKLVSAIVEVRNRRPAGSNPKVNIQKLVHEGVIISLGVAVEEFTAEEVGPFSLIENTVQGGLRRLPLTGLMIPASELETACRAVEEAKNSSGN